MTKSSVLAAAFPAVALLGVSLLLSTGKAWAEPTADEGLRVFKSANCVGCHKWTGEGGGGYGGAAANLRHTALSLSQIEQTIRCGRPATGMPHFEADAYSDGRCYGLKKAQMSAATMPPEPDHYLRPADIEAVAKYVVTNLKGKGPPTYAQCQAFFGTATRACDVYQTASDSGSTPAGGSSGSSHSHLKIESAPDANASSAGK